MDPLGAFGLGNPVRPPTGPTLRCPHCNKNISSLRQKKSKDRIVLFCIRCDKEVKRVTGENGKTTKLIIAK